MRLVLLLVVLLATAAGCIVEPSVPTPPVPPPTPPAPEPTGLTRADFADVAVGADGPTALASLPEPHRTVQADGGKTLYAWRLDETRPSGGQVWWEVHVQANKVVFSGAW